MTRSVWRLCLYDDDDDVVSGVMTMRLGRRWRCVSGDDDDAFSVTTLCFGRWCFWINSDLPGTTSMCYGYDLQYFGWQFFGGRRRCVWDNTSAFRTMCLELQHVWLCRWPIWYDVVFGITVSWGQDDGTFGTKTRPGGQYYVLDEYVRGRVVGTTVHLGRWHCGQWDMDESRWICDDFGTAMCEDLCP